MVLGKIEKRPQLQCRTFYIFSCISFVILARFFPIRLSQTQQIIIFSSYFRLYQPTTRLTLHLTSSNLATPLNRSCYNSVGKLNEILTSRCYNVYCYFWLLRMAWIDFSDSLLALNVSVVGLERALTAYLKEPNTQPFDMKTVPIATQSIHEQKPIKTSEYSFLLQFCLNCREEDMWKKIKGFYLDWN